jgi:hypothetical protein
MSQLDEILAAVRAAPCLPGAKCRGKSHLFDPAAPGEDDETVAYRHNQAIGLCSRCESLTRCEEWYSSLPSKQRPGGIIAGQLRPLPVGRPRKFNPNPKGTTAP